MSLQSHVLEEASPASSTERRAALLPRVPNRKGHGEVKLPLASLSSRVFSNCCILVRAFTCSQSLSLGVLRVSARRRFSCDTSAAALKLVLGSLHSGSVAAPGPSRLLYFDRFFIYLFF